MPYRVAENAEGCSGFAVLKKSDGKVMGCHPTREKALGQLRALYASESTTAAAVEALAAELLSEGGAAAGLFDEAKHPRHPAGVHEGGRFMAVADGKGNFGVIDKETGETVAETTDAREAVQLQVAHNEIEGLADDDNLRQLIRSSTDDALAENERTWGAAPESQTRTRVLAEIAREKARRALGIATSPIAAAGAPLAPPAEWFADPKLDGPTPLTVTSDGRVFGHLAEWNRCHTAIGGRCVVAPRGGDYGSFHTGSLELADGTQVRVGKITAGIGHASLSVDGRTAAAHYDNTQAVAAFVRAGEDEFGPWLAGAVKSDATPEQIRDLRANPPSGDWRKLNGRGLELVAALAVPVPGFPVAAISASASTGEEEITALVMGRDDEGDAAIVAGMGMTAEEFEIRLAALGRIMRPAA